MGNSVQPVSTAAMAGFIQEIDAGAAALFGDPFAGAMAGTTGPSRKLARVLNMLRRRTLPNVIRSMMSPETISKITVLYRSRVNDPDDPLASEFSVSREDVDAVVSGPSIEDMESGFLAVSDYQVLIPAIWLPHPIDENDAIEIEGAVYDVVGLRAHPKSPPVVAYWFKAKRGA